MGPEIEVNVFRHALELLLVITSIVLLPVLGVGLIISMLQAATQINEMTLSFVPKLLIALFTVMVAGPFIMKLLQEFFVRLMHSIPGLIV